MISALLIEYFKKGIFTLLGAMLAVYLFVILLTYTGNDPSWSHISSDMTTVSNTGGAMGAWFSDVLYSFFGFGAWWLIAFLAYESIWLWWGNKSTYWLVRMMAYAFLLLSGSALITQLTVMFDLVPNWAMIKPSGAMGGIAGLELQLRLAEMLTPWGSVLFLTLFMLVTATFAFNIHWRLVYQKVMTPSSWLGSGVRDISSPNHLKSLPIKTAISQQIEAAKSAASMSAPLTKNRENEAPQGDIIHALEDFLVSSGLKASVQAAVRAAPQDSALMPEPAKKKVSIAEKISFSGKNKAIKTDKPKSKGAKDFLVNPFLRKKAAKPEAEVESEALEIEPSFDLNENDSKTFDDVATDLPIATPNVSTEPPRSRFMYSIAEDDDTLPQTQTADDALAEVDDSDVITEELMQLAMSHNRLVKAMEASFSEVETLVTDDEFTDASAANWQSGSKYQPVSDVDETPLVDMDWEDAAWAIEDHDIEDHDIEDHDSEDELIIIEPAIQDDAPLDMTPTNTPPANPTEPPKALDDIEKSVPPIQFAATDWQASEAIDKAADKPQLPDIHDDAAFATRSRAMQTAAYRAQLTPLPTLDILDKPDPNHKPSYSALELEQLSELLEIKLQEFNVKAEVVTAIPGPVVTRFEVELAAGVKASKVTNISRDLARSLSMASLRVVEVIAGKPYIGIEVPNKQREMVRLIELLDTKAYQDSNSHISMAMGKDISGKPIITDLSRAPHMLVAGTTGSGKSVLVNAMLLSMLLKYTPDELRLILIDPKQLELANYNDIPHLLTPVVTDMTEAASSLSWCVAEMERRYFLMSTLKVRKLHEFNKKVRAAERAGQPLIDPTWRPNDSVSIDKAPKLKTLPLIVIVADEFADMIMQVGKQAEELITRLAQKSRAAGIHLMLATQRPSVDVITGLIKANIPVRAALRVNSKVDSRTILDSGGAEDMLGNGDMLFLGPGQIEPDRVHGAYVSDEEVNRVCDAWRERGAPDYIDNMADNFALTAPSGSSGGNASGEDDDLYNEVVAFVMESRKATASSIQRKFSIGYNRAARIVDSMEEAGLVSPMSRGGKRELLM